MDGAILSAWSSYTSHAEALAAAVAQHKAARQVGVLLVLSCCPALPCPALPCPAGTLQPLLQSCFPGRKSPVALLAGGACMLEAVDSRGPAPQCIPFASALRLPLPPTALLRPLHRLLCRSICSVWRRVSPLCGSRACRAPQRWAGGCGDRLLSSQLPLTCAAAG